MTQSGSPAYLQQAYDLAYLSQTGGSGDTVAIVDAYDDPTAEADLATDRSFWGLPPCTSASGCFTKVNESGAASPLPGGNSDWEHEISLDLDAVSALCPNCHILLVETNSSSDPDLYAGIATAQRLGANQISNSWGTTTAATAPVSFSSTGVIASTGDDGWLGLGNYDYPAGFPGVTAVGGTTLTGGGAGSGPRGFSESAWYADGSGAGSGCDLNQPKPSYQTDTACTGRSYADVSADGDPHTGLFVYDTGWGGWMLMGGTSLAAPLTAASEAITQVNGATPQWAYTDSSRLNDPVTGSNGNCPQNILYICNGGPGYDGPTGEGSISGAVTTGAPGIGGPTSSTNDYTVTVGAQTATLSGGVYPNGLDTQYFWQYGTTTSYGQQTSAVDIGAGTSPAAAGASLAGLTPGTTYHYRLVAENSDGTDYGWDFTLTTAAAPVNSTLPAITGTAQQGQTLSASTGAWSPAATSYSYQWQRSTNGGNTWAPIAGQTASSYVPVAGDVGSELEVIVTATNAEGSTSATSTAVGPIITIAPVNSALPAITGTAQQGQTLTASTGSWNPAATSYSYQWQRSIDGGNTWTPIAGETASSYVPVAGDVGSELRVAVTATNTVGSISATSTATGPIITIAPVNSTLPAITGTAQQGQILTASTGAWNPAATSYSYQWQRSTNGGNTWTAIASQTTSTYIPATGDVGSELRVVVTATNTVGSTSANSAAVGPIASAAPGAPVNSTLPGITGTAQQGQTLTASTGAWNPGPSSYSYQWQRSTNGGNTWTAIAGQTASTYIPAAGDVGSELRVIVTATNIGGSTTANSPAAGPIASGAPQISGIPVISGTAQRSQVLSVGSTWSAPGATYTYQWQSSGNAGASWTNIGAGAATYTLLGSDEGTLVRVTVTATNAYGQASASSAPIGPVTAAPPVTTGAPSVSGTPQPSDTLSATQGSWEGAGNAYAYQWQRSSDGGATWTTIAGATTATYTLVTADDGDIIRILVTASNPDGSVSAASAPTSVVSTPLSSPPPALPPATPPPAPTPVTSTPAPTPALVVAPAAPSWTVLPMLSTGPGKIGDRLRVTPGAWSGGPVLATQVMRCTNVCQAAGSPDARTYTITAADLGAVLRVREIASTEGAFVVVWSADEVGPVVSAQAASAVLSAALTPLRSSASSTLALAQVTEQAGAAGAGGGHARSRHGRTVTVRRARNVKGPLTVWACLIAASPGGRPPPCTAKVSLRSTATLHLPSSPSGRVRVVVMRRGR